jgi:hypothetical protein
VILVIGIIENNSMSSLAVELLKSARGPVIALLKPTNFQSSLTVSPI